MTVFAIVIGVLIALSLIYLLVLVRPSGRVSENKVLSSEYAHRGYYGNSVPENSMQAFNNAINQGCGFEFDIQLSKDGKVMVFHDYTLKRMTGINKKLCELTCDELKQLKLADTDEVIPTLEEVLELCGGRVPLLIELKGENLNTALCEKASDILKSYKGDYCIESFNPLLLVKMKKLMPEVYRGQLYTNVCRDKKKYTPLNILLTAMLFNFLVRPHFIAYNKKDRGSLPVLITTKLYKTYRFVWTVDTQEELEEARSLGEMPIFEQK